MSDLREYLKKVEEAQMVAKKAPVATFVTAEPEAEVTDLHVNQDAPEFQSMVHAYKTANRVSAKGMSREQFIAALRGNKNKKA